MTSPKALTVLSLGWGVQSWTLAAMSALGDLPPVDYAIHADTTHEGQGTYAHAAKWTPWLEARGVKVRTVTGRRTDVVREDWGDTGSVLIPAFTVESGTGKRGQIRRQCTHDWKIVPIRRFLRSLGVKLAPGAVECLQGISYDEWRRMRDSDVAYITNVYPLVDAKLTRSDCISWLEKRGLDVPPKSSCVFCPYRSIASWKRLKDAGGPDWKKALAVDGAIRDRRPNHGPLYVHPRRLPLAQAVRSPEDVGQLSFEFEQPCDSGYCFV